MLILREPQTTNIDEIILAWGWGRESLFEFRELGLRVCSLSLSISLCFGLCSLTFFWEVGLPSCGEGLGGASSSWWRVYFSLSGSWSLVFFLGGGALCLIQRVVFAFNFGEGFLQSDVLGEVSVLEGGSWGRSFSRSLRRSFRACFAGTFREKNFSKNFSPKFPWLCISKAGEISGKTFMTRFCKNKPLAKFSFLISGFLLFLLGPVQHCFQMREWSSGFSCPFLKLLLLLLS